MPGSICASVLDLAASPRQRKLTARICGANLKGQTLWVQFEAVRTSLGEIEDRVQLGPPGDVSAVKGVGRLLRILKAAHVRAPSDPYNLINKPALIHKLMESCVGAMVELVVLRRMERVLTVWTDEGVERIRGVVDYEEDDEFLIVRRRTSQSPFQIPRRTLIRYAPSSREYFVVASIESSSRFRLR